MHDSSIKELLVACSEQAIHLPDSVEYVGVGAFSECIRAVDGTVPQTAEIEGYAFQILLFLGIQDDGLFKFSLRDYNYLFIDWVKYLAGENGITLYEFEKITIGDIADIGKLQTKGPIEYINYEREINMLRAFLTKDTAALEEYSRVPAGTYDLYKTLEFGEYTIT